VDGPGICGSRNLVFGNNEQLAAILSFEYTLCAIDIVKCCLSYTIKCLWGLHGGAWIREKQSAGVAMHINTTTANQPTYSWVQVVISYAEEEERTNDGDRATASSGRDL